MTTLTADEVLGQLSQKDSPALELLAQCRMPDNLSVWTTGPALPRRFARVLLAQSHPTFALEVAARGLATGAYPGDAELEYCQALALANCGNATRALSFVKNLLKRDDLAIGLRSDGLALAGRVAKDQAVRAIDPAHRDQHFRRALWCYRKAFELSGDTFPCINAATLALLCGEVETSRTLAAVVRDKVLADLDDPTKKAGDYWALATLGEAYLLLGDAALAHGRYAQAIGLARENHHYGPLASMLRQLRLIRERRPAGGPTVEDGLLGLFRLGPVVAFVGHNLDRPGDPFRFPADVALEAAVRRAIKHELDALEPAIGYCSPGNGSEILFGELMRQRDAELHVVLPFAEEDFRAERLTFGLPELEGWRQRYETLRGVLRVSTHFATTEEYLGDRVLYDFAATFVQGLALIRAAQLGTDPVALVVQDPSARDGQTGTALFIANWERRTGRKARVIDLAAIRDGVALAPLSLSPYSKPQRPHLKPRTVKAMLFADVSGFSRLPEPYLPAFFEEFLKLVKQELEVTPAVCQNTWGDGLYLVFEDAVTCAGFALGLLERFESFDFPSFGFRLTADKMPGVRIGLHTGPVFEGFDAVIGRDNYFGSHVTRAARIEPVSAPGSAFVSEQFAAALAMTPGHGFVCEYLGMQPLAKDYADACPLYRLARSDAPPPKTRGSVGTPGGGDEDRPPAPLTDEVTFSVTAPGGVVAGSSFVLQVWAYLERHAAEVLAQARAAQGGKEVVPFVKPAVLLPSGAVLSVRVRLPDLEVGDEDDAFTWTGRISSASFPVRVPGGLLAGGYNGLAEFFCGGLRIAKIHFTVTVAAALAPVAVVTGRQDLHRSAFASYASLDRREVLARVQGMQKVMPRMRIFLDVHDLRSGEDWRARLEEEIGRRDVLYLFWSANARASEHVEWEWRTALRLRGLDGIDPVPLAPPEEVLPPEELAGRHFNDWTLAFARGRA